jgi:pyruvate ferredoxin oxidoreductase gamma subunit
MTNETLNDCVKDSVARPRLVEVRIHGRGGQGNVIAAYILASAAFEDGRFGQAFPSFGPERRGAPVAAFVRIADEPVRRRSQVRNPNFLIIQDEALLHVPGITEGLRAGGGILVNSSRPISALGLDGPERAISVPATALATEVLGRPIPNTALLAAFLSLTEIVSLEALERALARQFEAETLARNIRLVHKAALQVPRRLWLEAAHAATA